MTQRKEPPAKSNGRVPNGKEPERLPAYFLSLTLENVRCFGSKAELKLTTKEGKPAQWTIILGVNGTGKTTLLQSLVGFELLPVDEPEKFAPRFLILNSWNSPGVTHAFPRDRHKKTALRVEVALMDNLSAQTAEVTDAMYETRGNGKGTTVTVDARQLYWCCAYGAGRRVGAASLGESALDDSVTTLFSDRAELRNPEEWLLQLDYAAKSDKPEKEAQKRFDQAKRLLLDIMPEDEISDIECKPGSGPNPKARVEFKTRSGWVPLRQLGYGYQTLITWVADLVSRMAERYPDSKNPLAEPAVVLVDEIDLHLHPKWQRKLMGFLTERFPNTQFIATAHSPLVVQAAADANLAVLRWEGDHVVIDNEVDNIRNWRIDQILTSDLFGLETARPPQVEALLLEQKALLSKPKLTAADERRVKELDVLIGELPFGETKQERQEREEIRKTLDLLMKERKERKPAS
jgi:energy-coupling factor transporter ATP-binding protein EcfA2